MMEQNKENLEMKDQTLTDETAKAEGNEGTEQGTEPNKTEEEASGPEQLPPLTYIDFVPQCLGSSIDGKEPDFAEFGTVVEQANQWLLSMPQFSVYKCETLTVKLGPDHKLDNDVTLMHTSSNGKNVYIRILRVWLIPKADTTLPVQQIAYITILPDHSSGDLEAFLSSLVGSATTSGVGDAGLPSFDNLTQTVEKLNKHLQAKPLSGRILTIETLTFKCQEAKTTDKLNTEAAVWSEGGANAKLFINGFRIYYIVGQPAYETIGIHDEEPDMLQSRDGLGLRLKFATFQQTVGKAAQWLQKQQAIRVVNIQTVNVKLERKFGSGAWLLHSDAAGYTETQTLQESRYSKVLRIAYVKDQKLENPSPYSSVNLTSRIFVPNKIDGKKFETFSKTMLRVIRWLNATRIPVFACETVKYLVSADSAGQGFNEERPDYLVNTYHGQYYMTCVRLYFPSVFQEPPPEVPDTEEVGWGWGCVVS